MKKSLILITILLISISLMGHWVDLSQAQQSELFECEQQTRSNAQIEFTLDGFDITEKVYAGETYSVINHENAGELLDIGMPDLPIFTKALIIPSQGNATVEIISYDQTEYFNIKVYPQEALQYESEPQRDNFTINASFYQGRSSVYPQEIAWAGEPAIMRDFRMVPVTFSPFQYDPVKQSLTVYSNIVVQVNVSGTGGINAKYSERKRSRAFENMYHANTLNYDQLALRDEYQVPTILFICNDNDIVLTNLAYLTDWKKEKGFNVVVATTSETGTTNTAIKNYIQDAYDNWENPPEYVNIMGDGSGSFTIPTWYNSGSYGEGDHQYSQLEGGDVLGDVIMGRMTFSSESVLQTVINKVLSYEKTPYMGNTEWYSRAMLTGDPLHSGYSTISLSKAAKEMMLDFPGNWWSDDNFVEIYSGSFPNLMNAAINLGVSYYGYRGWLGMSGWSPGSTTNGYMMPFANIPTCSSNNWESGTGKAEGFYLQGTTSLPGGGIGALGSATSGTHTPFNNAIAHGIWGGIFVDDIYNMGGAVLQGKYYLWLTFPQFASSYVNTFSVLNTLMGDGSVELWTGVPQNLSAIYEEVIPTGANYYQVAVLDSIGNNAEGAWVTLKEDGGEFVASEFCDYSGSVILDLDGAPEGDYILTITKHDHIPISEEVVKDTIDQYIDISSVTYDDASGNSNGIVNPGETVEVMITLGNTGSSAVNGIDVALESNSDFVTVITTAADFGNIASGSSATQGFEIEVDPAIQGGVDVNLGLTITDDDGNLWHTWLMVPIEGASLYASAYTIDGNGVIDPGETEDIYFTVTNNGSLSASGVDGILSCNNQRITITDEAGSFGNVAAGGSNNNSTNRFTITASNAILPGTYIPFIIHLTNADGYDSYTTINVSIGEPEETDPFGPDEYGYWCYDDGDVDYDKCPDYDWVEIDPDYDGYGTSISWAGGNATGNGGGTGNYANIDFPEDFTFVYYGEEYDEMTVCTNGWVAPGYHDMANFMNYQIPGPQGPSPMIAVFWDDLNVSSGDVLWYYDDDLHYVVVQWSRIENGDTSVDETFQVVMYDPIYYPTTTGDSEIKMQYLDVTNNNAGNYPSNHGQFCTVGLKNEDSTVGLQYTFNNSYPEACKTLTDEMAILFTPPPIPPEGPFLSVNSFYAFAGDDAFIEAGEDAIISLVLENMGAETAHNINVEISINDPYVTVIDNSGTYAEIPANGFGTLENEFSLEISENVPDFYIFYLEAIISCDENGWNWLLPFTAYWANTFTVDTDSVYYELQLLETGSQQFTLTNIGDLPVNFYIRTDETTLPGRDISGSAITMDTDSFTPGEEATWTFTVYNASSDNEWLSDTWIDFPLGVSVLDAGDVMGGSDDMIWDGVTGPGQRVNWHGETAYGFGVVHDGEMASWEVDVLLSTEFAGDMTIGWEVGGDGYGDDPHNVTGEINLLYPLRWMNLDMSSGTLQPDESQVVTINFDSSDIEEGVHTGEIVVTNDSWDSKSINVVLDVRIVGEDTDPLPTVVKLTGNYPNPFNPETEINFQLPTEAEVQLKVYNSKGQLVRTLADAYFPSGSHSLSWNGKDNNDKAVGSGVYFYTLTAYGENYTNKMVLLK